MARAPVSLVFDAFLVAWHLYITAKASMADDHDRGTPGPSEMQDAGSEGDFPYPSRLFCQRMLNTFIKFKIFIGSLWPKSVVTHG